MPKENQIPRGTFTFTAANEIVQAQNNYSTEITHNINDMYDIIK